MRGRTCPKVWVSPVPERICPKVLATSSKSLASRAGTRKSWLVSKNLPAFRRESLSTISGALAIAEALGIFGREGVDLACYWTYPDFNTPGFEAMKLSMNVDETNSPFGFTSVHAASSHDDLLSCYAAVDDSSNVLVMVLNKSQVADLTPDIGLAHLQAHQIQVYQISEDKPQITRLADAPVSGARLKFTFPASSITLLRLIS